MAAPRLSASELLTQLVTLVAGVSILPKDVGASENGTAVNCTGKTHATGVLAVAAASASTDFTIKVQKSPDGSTGWTDVPAAEIYPAQPATINDDAAGNHNKLVFAVVSIDAAKPHLRWTAAGTGGTPALLAAAGFVQGSPLSELKPYQLEQLFDALRRRFYDRSSGEPPSGQPTVRAALGG